MRVKDIGQITSRQKTPEGYLKVSANIARTGIYRYYQADLNNQIPLSVMDTAKKNNRDYALVIRRPEDVFDPESLKSFENQPVTDGHPAEWVDSKNVSNYQKGFTKEGIVQSGDFVKAKLIIQDKKLIDKVNAGKVEISNGHESGYEWESGIDPVYGPYDGYVHSIVGNHIAIVDKGRAGKDVRIMDKKPTKGKKKMSETRTIDGISFEFEGQAIQAVDKLVANIATSDEKRKELVTEIDSAKSEIEKATKTIDTLKGELDAEKAKALDSKAIDALVKTRTDLIDNAKTLHSEIATADKSGVEIQKEAILFVKDSFDLSDKSDEYIDAVFNTLLNVPTNDESKDLADKLSKVKSKDKGADYEKARAEHMQKSRDAWKK